MDFFETAIVVVHLLVCLALIGLVLLQQGKGAEAGASFGAGASQTVFGSQGSANFMTRSTKWLAVVFFATSMALAYVAKEKSLVAGQDELINVPQASQEVTTKPAKETAGVAEESAAEGESIVLESAESEPLVEGALDSAPQAPEKVELE